MSELRPCPFCDVNEWKYQSHFSGTTIYQCEKCGTIVEEWVINIRPIEDALHARIAELEGIVKADNLRLINAGLSAGLYSGCDTAEMMAEEILASRARITELEAAQRWHVVDDGDLPVVGKSIMFYDSSSGEIYRGVYTASHHWRANYFSEKCGIVTHWMPLPKPPEVQE